MSMLNRRQSLKLFLGGLLQAGGTVVLASAVLPARGDQVEGRKTAEKSGKDLEKRANQVADAQPPNPDEEVQDLCAFLNGGFANGGFRKGGFVNGGFRNGGFTNGSFRNGGFANGGFRNGGFVNGGFRNG
jgi:hypothetical protein